MSKVGKVSVLTSTILVHQADLIEPAIPANVVVGIAHDAAEACALLFVTLFLASPLQIALQPNENGFAELTLEDRCPPSFLTIAQLVGASLRPGATPPHVLCTSDEADPEPPGNCS